MSYEYSTGRVRILALTSDHVLTADDIGKVFRNDSTSNITVTVPKTLISGFSAGFIQDSTGTITISAGTSAVNRSGVTTLSTQYGRGSVFVFKQNSSDTAAEFLVGGDFA